jgi:hypothetical protein
MQPRSVIMDYAQELEQVRAANGGVLRPADVVEFAMNPETVLHGRFEWDDTKAAEQYRLWQARELIRVVVQTHPAKDAPTRVYVSLADDRGNDGGGYRTLDEVLRSKAMREALLAQAQGDMMRFEAKYHVLRELASVVAAMRSLRGKQAPSQ